MTAVRIPPVLRAQVGGQKQVEVVGETVGQVIDSLLDLFPSLREQLLTADGTLNRFVNVYVNGRDVRYEQELATPVSASSASPTVVPTTSICFWLPAAARSTGGIRTAVMLAPLRSWRRSRRA